MPSRKAFRALSVEHRLGAVVRVHRERHPVWSGWARYAAAVAGVAALLCAVRDLELSGSILLATGTVIYGHALLAEIPAPAGRRWIAVCAGGLIVASEWDGPVVVRWSAVSGTLRVARKGVSWTPYVFYQPYQVFGRTVEGRPVCVPIGTFVFQDLLVETIEERVSGRLTALARRALDETGRADFGPVSIVDGGIEVRVGGLELTVPRKAFLADDSRIMLLTPPEGYPQLGAIPVNRVMLRLLAERREPVRSSEDGYAGRPIDGHRGGPESP